MCIFKSSTEPKLRWISIAHVTRFSKVQPITYLKDNTIFESSSFLPYYTINDMTLMQYCSNSLYPPMLMTNRTYLTLPVVPTDLASPLMYSCSSHIRVIPN